MGEVRLLIDEICVFLNADDFFLRKNLIFVKF
jgi:hypothetical protein